MKSLIVYNANPVSVAPDGSSVRKGLEREDLFTIVHEQVMSPTARYADLLLPATTFLENRDLYTAYGHFYFGVAEPVIEPLGESLSNFDFFQTFARKMGYTDSPFQQSLDQRLRSYLATLQGAVEGLLAGRFSGWRLCRIPLQYHRRSGSQAQKQPYSFCKRDDPTVPPFACLIDAAEFDHPDLGFRFPYKLITPPDDKLLNSTFGERYQHHCGRVLIHPEDAAMIGIKDGEEVRLENFRGSTVRLAELSRTPERVCWLQREFIGRCSGRRLPLTTWLPKNVPMSAVGHCFMRAGCGFHLWFDADGVSTVCIYTSIELRGLISGNQPGPRQNGCTRR